MEEIALTYADYVREILISRPWEDFGLPREGKVLDIGSGGGWAVAAIRGLGLRPIGLDTQPGDGGTVRGSGTRLPFRSGTFDGVVCLRTLHHIRDDEMVLSEAARVIRPRGFLLLAVGNRHSYTMLPVRLRLKTLVPNPLDPYYRFYARKEIRSALLGAGFEVLDLCTCHFLPRLLSETRVSRPTKSLAAIDGSLGRHPIFRRIGPLLLVHGVKR